MLARIFTRILVAIVGEAEVYGWADDSFDIISGL